MGEHVNTRWQNIINWTIVLMIVVVSTLFAISTLFPKLFGQA
jgi:Mn2+/Fe2+ NRAMP family transporter